MAAFQKFNSAVEALAHKVHNLSSDQLGIALCNAANAPVAANSQLSDLTTVSLANLLSDDLTTSSSGQSAGIYRLIIADFTLEASGGAVGPFRYVVVYNKTATNDELLGFHDIGQEVTLADTETLLLDFNNVDGYFNLQ